jgi:hypothetical protein
MSPSVVETVLAGLNVDRTVREAITGDMIEERTALAALLGERRADRWMQWQIIRSVPVFVHEAVRDGGFRLLATIAGAALAALLVVSMVAGVSMTMLQALMPPETIAHLMIAIFAIDLASGAAGGYLAARLGRAAPLATAFVVGVLGAFLTLLLGVDAPGWYRPALLLLLVPATLSGGWLHARHLARHTQSA